MTSKEKNKIPAEAGANPPLEIGTNKTDAELVKLTLANQDNFLYLIKRYEAKLLAYIFRISNFSREEAEDVLQDVFIKVYENLNDFDTDLKFSSWIYRIARNQTISQYRRNKARPKTVSLETENDVLKLAAKLDIEKEVDIKYLRTNIEGVLSQLDRRYREVLVLKFLEEKDYKEISDILEKPMGTVATLIRRAKEKFREAGGEIYDQ